MGLTVKPTMAPNNFQHTDGQHHIFWVGDFIIFYTMNTGGWVLQQTPQGKESPTKWALMPSYPPSLYVGLSETGPGVPTL